VILYSTNCRDRAQAISATDMVTRRAACPETRPPGVAVVVSPDPQIPDVGLLETALGLLGVDMDGGASNRGADDAHRRAAILTHAAAWSLFLQDTVGQRDAGMSVPELAELHADADRSVANVIAPAEAVDSALLHLQIVRLVWVHHALLRLCGHVPDPIVDAALAGVAGVVDLLAAAQLASGAPANGAGPNPLHRAEALLGRAHKLLAARAAGD
jgi:hypothetical protein